MLFLPAPQDDRLSVLEREGLAPGDLSSESTPSPAPPSDFAFSRSGSGSGFFFLAAREAGGRAFFREAADFFRRLAGALSQEGNLSNAVRLQGSLCSRVFREDSRRIVRVDAGMLPA